MRPKGLHRLGAVPGIRARLGVMCAIACATSIAACGGGDEETDGTIPQTTGDAIVMKLEEVRTQFDAGDCDAAEATAEQIQGAIAGLGSNVEGELEQALVQASGNLVKLTREDCEEPPPPDTGATGEEGAQEAEG